MRPAVALLSSLRNTSLPPPALSLGQTRVAQGGSLPLTVTSGTSPTILFVVREDGAVKRIAGEVGASDNREVQVPVRRVLDPPGQPQLILALSAADPQRSLGSSRTTGRPGRSCFRPSAPAPSPTGVSFPAPPRSLTTRCNDRLASGAARRTVGAAPRTLTLAG